MAGGILGAARLASDAMTSQRPAARQPARPQGRGAGGAHPRPGPHVYRRRRILAAALAVAVLVLLGLGVAAVLAAVRGGDDPADAGDPSLAASPTDAPEPSATAGFIPTACAADALAVTETGAREMYWGGNTVTFTLSITNAGRVPCLVDGGTAALGVIVTSGVDRVWASVDCPQGETERMLLLDVGSSEALTVEWDQVRSAPGCPGGQASALPGVYRAALTVDGGLAALPGWEWVFAIQ